MYGMRLNKLDDEKTESNKYKMLTDRAMIKEMVCFFMGY